MKKRALTGLLCLVFFSGCASGAESGVPEEQTEEMLTLSEEELQEEKMFGAVSYFDEDTDGLLQYADGYLYGYLGGRLFRVDAETGEVSVLFETAGTRSIHFCIDNDILYFLTIPQISFVNGTKADLYQMNCDGSGLILLAEEVTVTDSDFDYSDEWKVQMSVCEDVLYIIFGNEVCCFRLLADGSVKEADLKDTLYGLLPDGYSAPGSYSLLPSIPYSAAHYGYFFAEDEKGHLLRIDARNGQLESIMVQKNDQVFVTHEGIYAADSEKQEWTRYDLEDVAKLSNWREYDPDYFFSTEIVGWEENGAFLLVWRYNEGAEGNVQLLFADWEGNETPLVSFWKETRYVQPYGMEDFYVRDGWLYYRDGWEDGYWLMRISLTGGEPEKLYRYEVWPGYGMTEEEIVEKNMENTGEIRISTRITRLWLKDDEEGAAEINAALREIYEAAEAEMEVFNGEMLDAYLVEDELSGEELDDWLAITGESYKAYIEYVDEDYLCVSMNGDRYVKGAAHGYTWSDFYVFDRHTGQRLSLEDFVNNSPEEIREMVRAYIVADVPYTDGDQSEDALEQDRFFMTTEGLGIHYDVYEIGSYSEGPCDIIIPFELFDMKEGMQPGGQS